MSRILNFERILCPVAESHETDDGLLYAIALARSYRAKLFVLTCSDDSSRIDSDTVDAMRASIQRAVEHSCVLFPWEVAGGHLDYEFVVTESSRPADAWISQSAEGPYHVAAKQLHRSVPAETHLWCDVTHVVREGKAHREIVSYAVEKKIDLILIGAHGQGFKLESLFGSNTDRVLREAPCPVLVVRPYDH